MVEISGLVTISGFLAINGMVTINDPVEIIVWIVISGGLVLISLS